MAAPDDDSRLPTALEAEVLAILDGDEAQRDPALQSLLAAHPQHAATVRAWLQSAGVPVPGAPPPAPDPRPADAQEPALPRDLGAFRLVAVLGRGGFGTVYRAEQQHPIRRTVAVKILNPGMNSREVLARFAGEREALNRLDHPGIARLLDAGTTPQGQPFFAMELVSGPPLARFCRQRHLPLRRRLELFLEVLDAMQHAHQKAVLHRDLSSNNVLVADPDTDPQPKIIDFGIAKSLSDPLSPSSLLTFQGTMLGTPEFMSPEQAAGRITDVDTRADVYSLGVQLYELLTDRLPIPTVELRSQGLAGIAAAIAQANIAPPSEVAPEDRQLALRGDLDAIVGKALAKVRDERYGSVADFAADLRRHLADQPVQVAPQSTWYRLRKFVRRHRRHLAPAALGLLGLALAGSGMLAAARAKSAAERQDRERAALASRPLRILAIQEALREARRSADALPPPWPDHLPKWREWLAEHGEPLAAARQFVTAETQRLATRSSPAAESRPVEAPDPILQSALRELAAELGSFCAAAGPLEQVRHGLRMATELLEPALRDHAEAWQELQRGLRESNGITSHRDYRGRGLDAQPGLVPLGFDPESLLAEFLDLTSHPANAPIPTRGSDRRLALPPDCGLVFVLLPAGEFWQGQGSGQPAPRNPAAEADESPGQLVRLDRFLLARTEVTSAQWSRWSGAAVGSIPDLPAANLSWSTARQVLRRFDLELPTEAQWEYACRAGTATPWSTGADPGALAKAAWFGKAAARVGQRAANPFGLYDLHGNVAEWCLDPYLPYGESTARPRDGLRTSTAPSTEPLRVVRGGSFLQGPLAARSAARGARPADHCDFTLGLRPIRLLRRN